MTYLIVGLKQCFDAPVFGMIKLKRRSHTPIHLLIDDVPYFITGAIKFKRHLLAMPELKQKLLTEIRINFDRYQWELHNWVILDNHYHLLGKSHKGDDLPRIIRNIHSKTGQAIFEATKCEKPIWWNYWDYCPRDDQDYLTRLNYLLFNPIKHGYVKKLYDYPFSSFHNLFKQVGRELLVKQFTQYPDYRTLALDEDFNDDF